MFNPNLTLNSNVTILGNLTISGSPTTIQSTSTYINDTLIVFNNGYAGSPSFDIGIVANRNLQGMGPYGSVKTRGFWSAKEEERTWTDIENIKHSIDYELFHDIREKADKLFNEAKNLLLQEDMHKDGSYGIHNSNVHESCRTAFDIKQVIRHEFWKRNPNRSEMTVDSHIHFTSTVDSHKIKCNLDENE